MAGSTENPNGETHLWDTRIDEMNLQMYSKLGNIHRVIVNSLNWIPLAFLRIRCICITISIL